MATLTTPTRRSGQKNKSSCTVQAKQVRRDRIARAKDRIESGYYQRHDALIDLVAMRMLSDMKRED